MRLRDLGPGDIFRFEPHGDRYRYNGNGWYGWPYSGGPWHTRDNPEVYDGQTDNGHPGDGPEGQNLSCFI